ncbi:MAG: hypothetical protein UHN88_08255 [Eubacterium sp.]|nr:hypothetical protein [Eubacterium sp.]
MSSSAQEKKAEEKKVDTNEIIGGASLSQAQAIELGKRYTGKAVEDQVWVSFVTGSAEDPEYAFTLENLTSDAEDVLIAYLCDDKGLQKI